MHRNWKESNFIVEPVNGVYMSDQDFPEWNGEFGENYIAHDQSVALKIVENDDHMQTIVQHVTFVVTERCNLNCTYCYESHEHHKSGGVMTKEVAKRGIDMLFDKEMINGYYSQDTKKGVVLEFIGGEPLLEIDLIDYITDYFKAKAFSLNHSWATNYMVSISTNGVLYFDKRVSKYMEKNKGKVSLAITIDGNKDLHDACRLFPNGKGSFDIVEKAVYDAIDVHGARTTKLTLAPANIEHFSEAVLNLWEMGLQYIHANCVYEEGWDYSHATILYNELIKLADIILKDENYSMIGTSIFSETMGGKPEDNRNYCGGNGDMLAIGPDGVCYPCLRYMEHSMSSEREPFTCGDVDSGLESKATSKKLQDLCAITMSSQSDEKCNNCEIGAGCGVCTAYNYDIFGDPNKRATFSCVMHQARALGNYYFWNKLYSQLGMDNRKKINIPKEWALEIISEEEFEMLIGLSK